MMTPEFGLSPNEKEHVERPSTPHHIYTVTHGLQTDFPLLSFLPGHPDMTYLSLLIIIIVFFWHFTRGPCNNWHYLGHVKRVVDDDDDDDDDDTRVRTESKRERTTSLCGWSTISVWIYDSSKDWVREWNDWLFTWSTTCLWSSRCLSYHCSSPTCRITVQSMFWNIYDGSAVVLRSFARWQHPAVGTGKVAMCVAPLRQLEQWNMTLRLTMIASWRWPLPCQCDLCVSVRRSTCPPRCVWVTQWPTDPVTRWPGLCVVAAERYDPEADDDDGAKVSCLLTTWGQRSDVYIFLVVL